ncbi:uncharacterized protein [Rutidosis leptorrhynchoides]|uniref:uncharacterized protein n=1 Tax=Rutidosis leptorrhynchoides TaxID=125765 RepID=UPI003A99C49B
MALKSGGDGDELEVVPDHATWTLSEENTFISIMAKEVKTGKRYKTTFSDSNWLTIEHEFYEKTHRRYNRVQFRNKYNQLRTRYLWFDKLLKEPGFTWDPVHRTAIADDDVWESYLKTNKNASRFRKKGCPMYNELVIIFGDTICNDAYPLAQYRSLSDEKVDQETESTNETPRNSPIDNINSSSNKDSGKHGTTRHRPPSPTHSLLKNKEAKLDLPADTSLRETVKVTVSNKQGSDPVSDRTQAFKNLNVCPEPGSYSITNCVKCLESIDDLDAATYVKAIKLFKDVDWREMFMAMSAKRRLDWLTSLD